MPWKTALIASLLLTLAGCSSAAERTLLTQFFAASRLRDLTALRNIATVVFEPATDGTVTSFDLVAVAVTQAQQGEPIAEDVSISAPVRLPDGRTVVKTFVVTMQRSDLARRDSWMITAIKAGPASPSTPRS
jgi:hypothetical protein